VGRQLLQRVESRAETKEKELRKLRALKKVRNRTSWWRRLRSKLAMSNEKVVWPTLPRGKKSKIPKEIGENSSASKSDTARRHRHFKKKLQPILRGSNRKIRIPKIGKKSYKNNKRREDPRGKGERT